MSVLSLKLRVPGHALRGGWHEEHPADGLLEEGGRAAVVVSAPGAGRRRGRWIVKFVLACAAIVFTALTVWAAARMSPYVPEREEDE